MGLRCKVGDLAVIVRSYAGNEGKLVTCIRLATYEELAAEHLFDHYGPCWVTDRFLPGIYMENGQPCVGGTLIPDCQLRPIPGGEGEDEMLRIAGKPQPYEAPSPWETITEEER